MRAPEKRGIVDTEHLSVVTASTMEAKAGTSGRTRWVSGAAGALRGPVDPPA